MSKGSAESTDNIAIFLPTLGGGGAERMAVMLANGLAGRGHRVHLLVGTDEGPNRAELSPVVSLVDFGRGRVRSCVVPLARWLRVERPRVLLSIMRHANLAAIAASRLSRSPHRLVLSERGSASHAIASERPLTGAVIAQGIRYSYRLADAVVAVSGDVARDLALAFGLPESLLHIIHNPVDGERVRAEADREFGAPWWPARNVPTVLSVGRLTQAKDHLTLLEAFARLRRTTRACLVILGEGEMRTVLEGRIRALGLQEDVALPGYVTNPFPAMARANCFVLSSAWEGFPNALVEAAALGIPIVATDCPGGPREILGEVEGAELVPVGDAQMMAEAIERSLGRPHPVAALMRRIEHFSVSNALTAYEEVLGVRRAGR